MAHNASDLALQRVPQLFGPHQGSRLGRRQRPQVEAAAKVDAGERRLSRPNNHRGANALGRNGRVVQSREAIRQVFRIGFHPAADQCGDQRRGKGQCVLLPSALLPINTFVTIDNPLISFYCLCLYLYSLPLPYRSLPTTSSTRASTRTSSTTSASSKTTVS